MRKPGFLPELKPQSCFICELYHKEKTFTFVNFNMDLCISLQDIVLENPRLILLAQQYTP